MTTNGKTRHAEAIRIYRATVIDLVSRDRLGTFCFSAETIEDARPRAWRIAGSRFGNGIHVRVEQLGE